MICCGLISGCLISVFYLGQWQWFVCSGVLLFLCGYFKAFSSVLAGFILGIFVTICHYWLVYAPPIAEKVLEQEIAVAGVVSKVMGASARPYVTLELKQLGQYQVPWYRNIRVNASLSGELPGELNEVVLSGTAVLKPFRSRKNFSVFDAELYAFRSQIFYKGRVVVSEVIVNEDKSWRAAYRDWVAGAFDGLHFGWFYYVLLTGDKSAIAQADKDHFKSLGLSHLLAISGLHVAIVFALSFALCKLCLLFMWPRLSQWHNYQLGYFIFALGLSGGYVWLSGLQVSAQRAWLMALLGACCFLFARQLSPARVLLYALAVILIANPFAVLNLGLYFSFLAVVTIFFVFRTVMQGSERAPKVKLLCYLQCALFVALLPLTLYSYHGFSASSILVNLLVVPVLTMVIFPLLLLHVLAALIMDMTLLGPLDALLHSVYHWANSFPYHWQSTGTVSIELVTLGYLTLLLCTCAVTRIFAWIPLSAGVIFSVLERPPDWQVDVFDVGHGTAVLVSTQGKGILIDLGASYFSRYSLFDNVIKPYLEARRIGLLHTVISHDDSDHNGGLADLYRYDGGRSLEQFHGGDGKALCTIQMVTIDNLTIESLWPIAPMNTDNNNSCVIRVSDGNTHLLLPGDIEQLAEHELLALKGEKIPADILIAPHHGSNTSSSMAFVSAVAPRWVVFSRGYYSPWRLPHEEVVKRYQSINSRMLDTAIKGQIRFKVTGTKVQLETARDRKSFWFLR
ncbi:DNA internalization-related competence protein ComEC/Rec2 [Pseudoalteromonas sp. McH1-42]|uniref:DNA internalization-related competence protein ComEC/Rec2 n=1 Tax=Pseudoalteromonas sp. McH1-42 TaxID=2917752 RepID=UPI0023B77751|nr:DNA internalization-related competence protein ComEC/Rec2 [Pseudoalteromonas sp. McH1-42]